MRKIKRLLAAILCTAIAAGMALPVSASALTKSGEMKIENGRAQQIVAYSDARSEGYSNLNSDILRFTTYVETDYDTDLDGKPDLVKALIQLPRPAAEGSYKAPVIFEARPYNTGKSYGSFTASTTEKVTDAQLGTKPQKRTPSGIIDTVTHAEDISNSEWNYTFPQDKSNTAYPDRMTYYDYFLVRGFAVVQASGLGTYGSEGIECCGTRMEADALKNIIEWLNGKRRAFTDRTSNVVINADWASGKVGMIGASYAGALAFEVAATGVEGLETVVPIAGVSSWYDYSNSQGICRSNHTVFDYTGDLMKICASNLFTDIDDGRMMTFQQYLGYVKDEQTALECDYGDYWAARDFSSGSGIKASALIVQGLNDNNVCTKHFDLMRTAFLDSGCEVKCLLHQSGHTTLFNPSKLYEIKIGNRTYSELLNLWFTHYLMGVDNGAQTIPSMMVQSNVDGVFYSRDKWNDGTSAQIYPTDIGEHNITSEDAHFSNEALLNNVINGRDSKNSIVWRREITSPMTLDGTMEIHVRAKTNDIDKGALMMSAMLVDRSDTEFGCYELPKGKSNLTVSTVEENVFSWGEGLATYSIAEYQQTMQKSKIIATGSLDLRNPEAGYQPSTSVKRAEPIRAGEWYDYTIYLQPNYYTVASGHHLELYLMPFCNFSNDESTYEVKLNKGENTSGLVPIMRNYSFTVDNSASYAQLPVTEERPFLMGDSSRDGVITITDATLVQKAAIKLAKLSDMSREIGDVNGDGKLTISDVTCIQRYLSRYGEGFGKTGKAYIS